MVFETFLNEERGESGGVSMSELVAAYTDNVLRKGSKIKLMENEFDE